MSDAGFDVATSPPPLIEFVSPLGPAAFSARRLEASEALGELPRHRVELLRASTEDPVAPADLLGRRAAVKLLADTASPRWINGFVTHVERGGQVGRFDIYRLELRPWLWHLTLATDCRIFSDKTVLEILDSVFAGYSSAGPVEKSLASTPARRAYTVQYRESDFDFVLRLMQEEGLYFFFKHLEDQHVLVLCDHPGSHEAMAGGTLQWSPPAQGQRLSTDVVTHWSRKEAQGPLRVVLADYAAEAPSADLKAQASRSDGAPPPGGLEVFDYPGGHDDGAMAQGQVAAKQEQGRRRAQLRVDAIESQHMRAIGSSRWPYVACGFTFDFTDHVDAGGYLVTRADYHAGERAEADQSGNHMFQCRFECIPKATRYMPPATVTRPTITGPQTALVVGPAGDEIHTDTYGRVKLQFHWDRVGRKDENSSCWVRVSHPWAGKQFGMIALPRVGEEVVVEFLDGDPARPLVTGRVYNGDNLPPYALPAQATVSGIRTRSSQGGADANANELRFDDKKGSEYVWLQAERDFHRLVRQDAFDTVGRDSRTDVAGQRGLTVGKGLSASVGEDAVVKVGKDTHAALGADLHLGVGGVLHMDVTGAVAFKGGQAVALTAGDGLDVDVGQALHMSSGAGLHLKGLGVVIDGGTQLTLKAGAAFITLGPDGVAISGPVVKVNSGGSAGAATAAAPARPTAPRQPPESQADQDPLPRNA